MSEEEFSAYRQQIEAEAAELKRILARLGSTRDDEVEVPSRENSPLAGVYAGVRLAAEYLATVTRDLEQRVTRATEEARALQARDETIRELSSPVLRIWDRILILPLVGVVDARRARQIVVNLLQAIVDDQAEVVIIDVTGVPVIDTNVADHILKAIQAARMIGADVVLTGVSPRSALTLVKLGVEFRDVTTKASLKAGLRHALESIREASEPAAQAPVDSSPESAKRQTP